jgi:CRP/FNR family transcriptional regulator, cyclic AMP receptor protein
LPQTLEPLLRGHKFFAGLDPAYLTLIAGRGQIVVQTFTAGDVMGFSWLVGRQHRYQFDGLALARTRAIEVDGACLRGKCDADPKLGYELMRRFAVLATDMLGATRLQLLDVYGHAP